jgi:5-methylcytosine-specific restriction endonuclease McrA
MFAETLVLNHQFMPHEITDWQDAVTRMFTGKVDVLAQYDEVIAAISERALRSFPELQRALRQVIGTDTEYLEIKVPAVVVIRRPVVRTKTGVKFSKINLCARDSFMCQYCGARLPMSKLNYDHVMPRSRGGKTCWENVVMACYPCNSSKGCRLPDEAGMALLKKPIRPNSLPLTGPFIDAKRMPPEWAPYVQGYAA